MNDLDTLRPEVREALKSIEFACTVRYSGEDEYAIIRAELLRLADECATLKAQSIHPRAQLLIMLGHANDRAEKAEGDCNDLRKRLNDAISERNTIRRERAQAHSKHAREGAELAALKARIADGWLCGVSNDACPGNFDAAIYCLPSRFRGKRVRLVVEE